jgi:hypothetical protein
MRSLGLEVDASVLEKVHPPVAIETIQEETDGHKAGFPGRTSVRRVFHGRQKRRSPIGCVGIETTHLSLNRTTDSPSDQDARVCSIFFNYQ